jgi:hypothetical protein
VPLAFVCRALCTRGRRGHVNAYKWLVDELLYVRYAMDYASLEGRCRTSSASVRRAERAVPLLMAPLYAVFSPFTAFQAAHVLQGILWASSLIPVYLLARRSPSVGAGRCWPGC